MSILYWIIILLLDGKDFYLLKKSELTLSYTFFNITDRKIESIMEIDDLRNDGIGDLLVELGYDHGRRKNKLEAKFDAEDE